MVKWLNSVAHASRGILRLFRTERNTHIELSVALLAILLAWWLRVSVTEWCIILLCIGMVMTAEAFNTAIEELSNHVTKEWHPQIRKIKDMAAGAVLIGAILSLLIGLLVFLPKLIYRLS